MEDLVATKGAGTGHSFSQDEVHFEWPTESLGGGYTRVGWSRRCIGEVESWRGIGRRREEIRIKRLSRQSMLSQNKIRHVSEARRVEREGEG